MFTLQIMLLEQQICFWVNKFFHQHHFSCYYKEPPGKLSEAFAANIAIFSVLNPEFLPWLDNWPESNRKMFFVNERGFFMAFSRGCRDGEHEKVNEFVKTTKF